MNNLRNVLNKKFAEKQDQLRAVAGVLGDGTTQVLVPDQANWCYARINNEVVTVYNNRVSATPDLPVWIGEDPLQPGIDQVLGVRSTFALDETDTNRSSVPAHGETHGWDGPDPAPVWPQQIMAGRVAAYQAFQVVVYPILVWAGNPERYMVVEATPESPVDLRPYVPTTSNKALYVVVSIGGGGLAYTLGSEVDLTSLTYADIPSAPAGTQIVLAAVRLYHGQEAIIEALGGTDVVDLRGASTQLVEPVGGPYLKLDTSNGPITGQLASSVAPGTAPLAVTSPTLNANLNADLLDGRHATYFVANPMTALGDLIYNDGLTLVRAEQADLTSVAVMEVNEAETLIPQMTIAFPDIDLGRPVVIHAEIWLSVNTNPYDGIMAIMLRRDSPTGDLLISANQHFPAYAFSDDSGHSYLVTLDFTDNAPTTGVYEISAVKVSGFFGGIQLWSAERFMEVEGTSLILHAERRGIGSAGNVLTVVDGTPTWHAISHTTIGDIGTNSHAAIDVALSRLANTSGTNSGDLSLGGGSDPALSLSGQVLTLANVLTPAEHTAIGDGSPHHAAVTLATNHGLSLAGQVLALGTPGTVTGSSTNAVTTTTHTHALDNDLTSLTKYLLLTGGNLTGPLGVGVVTDANTNLYSVITPTLTAGVAYAGRFLTTATPAGASSATFYGLSFSARTSNNNANAFTGSVRGIEGTAYHNGNATLANLTGFEAQVGISLAGALGTVTNARGIRLTSLNVAAGATITNYYGLDIGIDTATATSWNGINIAASAAASQFKFGVQIGNISGGSGGNYALYTNTGLVRLGDQLAIAGSADRIQLQVTANGTQTTDLARFGSASHYMAIEADGTLKLVGNATGWKDIFFPQSPPKATGAGNPTLGTIIGNLRGYSYAVNDLHDFDPQEYGHDGKVNASITYHIHWYSMTNVAAARYAKWEIEETWCNPNAVINATTTTAVEVTIPANTPVGYQFVSDVLVKTPSGIGPATMLHCRIKRVAASGTAPAADPFCAGVHAHYEVDTPAGSRQITTK